MHVIKEPTLEAVQQQIRHQICRHCHWRTPGSESLDANVPRDCEGKCSVFRRLPELMRTAHLLDPMLRPPHLTLEHRILDLCRDDPGATARGVCPLRRYQWDVAEIVANAFHK
jgi:hypothetical protein